MSALPCILIVGWLVHLFFLFEHGHGWLVHRHAVYQHDCIWFDCTPRTTSEIWTAPELLPSSSNSQSSTLWSTSDTWTRTTSGLCLGPPFALLRQCGGFGPRGGGGADGLRVPPTPGPLAESGPAPPLKLGRRESRCSASSGGDDGEASPLLPRRVGASSESDVDPLAVWGNGNTELPRSSWWYEQPADDGIKTRR